MVVVVVKTHHGSSYGDAALLLDLHPVGGGSFANFIAFYGSRHVDSTSVEQEFLGERRFTRIRVRDDRKGAATQDFLLFSVIKHCIVWCSIV